MNIVRLNTTAPDGLVRSNAGGGNAGGGAQGGTTPSRPKWTGHADAEGLRAIGWTDEDIAYYQENGVNWNAEDDEYHKVSEDNKALYGVLTAGNISTYKDRIVYLPKIDTSDMTTLYKTFYECFVLVAIPYLDTSKVTQMDRTFYGCYSLVCLPYLDTSKVTVMTQTFYNCRSLATIPPIDTSNVTSSYDLFYNCMSLKSIPSLNFAKLKTLTNTFAYCNIVSCSSLKLGENSDTSYMFYNCYSLMMVDEIDVKGVALSTSTFNNCKALTFVKLKNIETNCWLDKSSLLSKDSLLYLINNEAATSAITIKLASYAYTRLANDADVVAALANHPNISISQ